jgi:hypothetical protein
LVAALASTENSATKNHGIAPLLSHWPSQRERHILNQGNGLSSNKNNPLVTQSLHSGIFHNEIGQMESAFF